jgi:hypothetical protein
MQALDEAARLRGIVVGRVILEEPGLVERETGEPDAMSRAASLYPEAADLHAMNTD